MKKYFLLVVFSSLLVSSCKKEKTAGNNTGGATGTCKLVFFKFSERAPVWNFEYNGAGKLAKTRYFSNGAFMPTTRLFAYDAQNRLTRIADSASNDYYTDFLAHNSAGNPTKALSKSMNKKIIEIEFIYDARQNISKKVFQFYDVNEQLLNRRDTLTYNYDAKGNVTKETAITPLNGIRREYILLEAEGYDDKISYYKTLGLEFNLLYRYNRSGEGTYNLGEYIYGICANNPGKVYLHNQGTDDNNKGDYLTYSYEYNSDGYPSKISQTYNASSTTSSSTMIYDCR